MALLVLGTAQWGSAYGVTNQVGRLSDEAVTEMVAVAREFSISILDTAAGYGDAEERLRPWADEFSITTKVAGAGDVPSLVSASLRALGRSVVDTVLLHDWDALSDDARVVAVRGLKAVLDAGVVLETGVSVYDEAGLASAQSVFGAVGVPLAAVQVPANAIDQRLDLSPVLSELYDQGTRIQVRSVFLQGRLLNPADMHAAVGAFAAHAAAGGQSLVEAALAHVKSLPWASEVVVGATSAAEFREIATAWESVRAVRAPVALRCDDVELIDPRRW